MNAIEVINIAIDNIKKHMDEIEKTEENVGLHSFLKGRLSGLEEAKMYLEYFKK